MNTLLFAFVGLAAGFVATRRAGATWPRPALLLTGAVGATLGGFLLSPLGPAARGLYGSLFTAAAGATLSLLLAGFLQRTARSDV